MNLMLQWGLLWDFRVSCIWGLRAATGNSWESRRVPRFSPWSPSLIPQHSNEVLIFQCVLVLFFWQKCAFLRHGQSCSWVSLEGLHAFPSGAPSHLSQKGRNRHAVAWTSCPSGNPGRAGTLASPSASTSNNYLVKLYQNLQDSAIYPGTLQNETSFYACAKNSSSGSYNLLPSKSLSQFTSFFFFFNIY